MKRRLPIFVILLLCNIWIVCLNSLSAQVHCDPSLLQNATSQWGYSDRGNRCEGLYVKQVGSTTLLVVSFTESFEQYDLKSSKPLEITWNKIPGNNHLHIRAQGIRRRLYYRMDSDLSPGVTSFTWPSNILTSLNIVQSDIGIVGQTQFNIGKTKRDIYIPLRITQPGSAVQKGNYKLILLPGVELSEVYLSLSQIGEDGKTKKVIQDGEQLGYGYYPSERGVEVPVLGLTESGLYYMEIGATVRGGGATTIKFWFYHLNK